ncbi:MAG TPA: energy transducer TonB [Gammaproteobacteria bacterium]|nr:energy transducer TonB [Gammaproteobacteria bacterium]
MNRALALSLLFHLALLLAAGQQSAPPPHPAGQALALTLRQWAPAGDGGRMAPPAPGASDRREAKARKEPAAPRPRRPLRPAAPAPVASPPPPPAQAAAAPPDRDAAVATTASEPPGPTGAATSRPVSRSLPGSRLRARLRAALAPHFHYPRLARRRGWEGTVELGMHITADGRLRRIRVVRGSGHGILDRAAFRALERLGRLPRLEIPLPGGGLDMILPVHYRLTDG